MQGDRGEWRQRARRGGAAAAALALTLVLSGCGSVWDDFFGPETEPERVEVPAEAEQAETPSLGSIPERTGATPDTQRRALQQGLQSERDNSRFLGAGSPAGDTGAQAASQAMAPAGTRSASDLPPAPQPRAGFDRPQSMQGRTQTSSAPMGQGAFPAQPTRRELVGVIYFAHGSANLDGRDREVLRQVRQMLEGTGGQLRVVGHASMRTDVLQPAEHARANFEMSQQRAASVANALNRIGVPESALVVEAFGAQQPVFYEFMPTGEAGNRRVEIYLEY